MTYFVYLIVSNLKNNKKFSYVGYTNNLNLRLKKHNSGIGAKATRGFRWKIIYKKKFYDKRLAMSFEYKLKNDKKNNLLMVIMNTFMNENFRDVS